MSINLSDRAISEAIYDAILAAYTQPPLPGLPPAHQPNATFIAYVWPGDPLVEADYDNPWTPDNDSGSTFAAENISTLVNKIPALSHAYTSNGEHITDVYELILQASSVATAGTVTALDQMEKPVFDLKAVGRVEADVPQGSGIGKIAAMSPDDLRLQELRRQYANASANLIAHRMQDLDGDPAAKEKDTAELEATVLSAWQAVSKGGPLAAPKRSLASAGTFSDPVAWVLSNANRLYTKTTLSSVLNPQLTYHPSYVRPYTFANRQTSAGWPFMPSIKVTTTGDASKDVSISFRFCRVDIDRPWLLMNLLQMRGWKIEGQPAGSLSNGNADDNPGYFPLLPEYFVVARDMVIAGVGDDKATVYYRADGLHILAWISTVVPFIPPL